MQLHAPHWCLLRLAAGLRRKSLGAPPSTVKSALASAQALAQIQASREQFAREQRAREGKRKHEEIEELSEVRLREARLQATVVGRAVVFC